MVQIGFALVTHSKPRQIRRLALRLTEMFDGPPIGCHHDFGQCPLDTDELPPNVRFVRPHYRTAWAEYSVVEATVGAIRLLYDGSDGPDWFVVLTGADYPIKSAAAITADLRKAAVDGYVAHRLIAPEELSDPWVAMRYEWYYRYRLRLRYLNRRLRPRQRMVAVPGWLGRIGTPFSPRFRCYAGSALFCANRRCAERILRWHDRHPRFRWHYRNAHVPEESYFHTILCNDPSLRIEDDDRRYIDWAGGGSHPKVLRAEDLPAMLRSPDHFARKFDPDVDARVLDLLDEATR